MTKAMNAGNYSIARQGDGGTFNSYQPDGFGTLVRLHDVMARFGDGPDLDKIIYAKFTGGADGEIVPLDSTEVGPDWEGSIDLQGSDFQPRYATMPDGETGATYRKGELLEIDNVRTGFQTELLEPHTEFTEMYQVGINAAAGWRFSGTTATYTLPNNSTCKETWSMDGGLSPTTADIVPCSYIGSQFASDGNRHASTLFGPNNFTFDEPNSRRYHEKSGTPDPYVDDGFQLLMVLSPDDLVDERTKTAVIAGGGSLVHQYTRAYVPGWTGSGPQDETQEIIRYYYRAYGDNSRAVIMIGDNGTYANNTSLIGTPPNEWTATRITTTLDDHQLLGATHMYIERTDGVKMVGALTAAVNGIIDVTMDEVP